jgi:hypothetical protein
MMKPQVHFTALALLGAALAGAIIGLTAGRAPQPVPVSPDAQQFQPAQPPTVPPDFIAAASSDPVTGHPKPCAPPIVPGLAGTPANDSSPAAPDVRVETDGREFFKIAETNPAAAVELAAKLDPSRRSDDLMEDLVQQWAGADLLAAAAWVKLNTSGDEQARLLQRVGFVLSQTNPADAAEFVLAQIPPGPVRDEAVMTVVNQWGNRNLAAAAAWVQTFSDGPLQERAVVELEGIENYRAALASSQN